MVFSSLTFLCLFLPVVLLLHTVVKNRTARNGILLAASLLFYAWGEPVWILAMLVSTAVNYLCARVITSFDRPVLRKIALAVGIVISVSALVYFKYSAFLVNSFCTLFGLAYRMDTPKLPIGISFYTFQIITYTVDVYRKKVQPQKNPLRLLLYVSLFPQLIAGPIVRYGDVETQFDTRTVTARGIGSGCFRFALGLGKKVLLANFCGEVLETLSAAGTLSFAGAWLGIALYCMQIYFDFAGYSDMAIGLGRMLGFRFFENFDAPFVSQSISEFWRRWHISLSVFFREYVYFPLGGSRVSLPRWIFNMAVVWGLTGVWHGASWNYLLWGLYFGLWMILERTLLHKVVERTPRVLKHILTLLIVVVGFVIVRYEAFVDTGLQFQAMFAPWAVPLTDEFTVFTVKNYPVFLLLCVFCCLPIRKTVEGWIQKRAEQGKNVTVWKYGGAVVALAVFVCSLIVLVGQSFNPFLYFRF